MKHRGLVAKVLAWLKGVRDWALDRLRARPAPVDVSPEAVAPPAAEPRYRLKLEAIGPCGFYGHPSWPQATPEELVDQPEPEPELQTPSASLNVPVPPLSHADVLAALGFAEGEEYPVPRQPVRFVDQPRGLAQAGGWTRYRHRETGEVIGVELLTSTQRIRRDGGVVLHGKPGDYLVRPAHGGRRFMTADQLDTYWEPVA